MEKIVIVDETDKIIGSVQRRNLLPGQIYRVAALFITNSRKEILLAKRALSKDKDPGLWGPAAAGTLAEGESYEVNIKKEAREELGLTGINLKKGPKQRVTFPFNHFTQWFFLTLNAPISHFKIQREEVDSVSWISFEDCKRRVEKDDPSLTYSLKQAWREGLFHNVFL